VKMPRNLSSNFIPGYSFRALLVLIGRWNFDCRGLTDWIVSIGRLFARAKPCVVAVLRGSVWAALLLSCKTGCSLYMIVYVYVLYACKVEQMS